MNDKRPKQWWEALWGFLNSGLGIWLLATIFVSFIPSRLADQQAKRERRERIQRLDLEIAYRLRTFNRKAASGSFDAFPRYFDEFRHGPNLLPEFKDTPSEALILDLRRLVPASQREELYTAFRAGADLPELADSSRTAGERA